MGRVIKGIALGMSGKVGDLSIHQQPDGSVTSQGLPKPRIKPFSQDELDGQQTAKSWNTFLKPVKDFIDVGFELEAKRIHKNQHNAIVRHICSVALVREGKVTRLDYSKILVTKGKMTPPKDAEVNVTDSGIVITWDKEIIFDGQHYTDQIMVLAYFPGAGQARFITAGAERYQGEHFLLLPGIEHGQVAEIYISFIKNNRKEISDSVHLGQINW